MLLQSFDTLLDECKGYTHDTPVNYWFTLGTVATFATLNCIIVNACDLLKEGLIGLVVGVLDSAIHMNNFYWKNFCKPQQARKALL